MEDTSTQINWIDDYPTGVRKVDSSSIDDEFFDDTAVSDDQAEDEEMTSNENNAIASSVQCFLSLFNSFLRWIRSTQMKIQMNKVLKFQLKL